eukprot:tig00021434_g21352.t1
MAFAVTTPLASRRSFGNAHSSIGCRTALCPPTTLRRAVPASQRRVARISFSIQAGDAPEPREPAAPAARPKTTKTEDLFLDLVRRMADLSGNELERTERGIETPAEKAARMGIPFDVVDDEAKEMEELDQYLDASLEKFPDAIKDRIIGRFALFAGLPALSGVLLPITLLQQEAPPPLWMIFLSSGLCFLVVPFAAMYSVISSSWNESVPGSLLGAPFSRAAGSKEFAENWSKVEQVVDESMRKRFPDMYD